MTVFYSRHPYTAAFVVKLPNVLAVNYCFVTRALYCRLRTSFFWVCSKIRSIYFGSKDKCFSIKGYLMIDMFGEIRVRLEGL